MVYSENTGRYRISDIKKARVTLIEGTCDEAFLNVAGRNEINAPMEIDPFTGADFVDIPDLPLNKTFAAVARGPLQRMFCLTASPGYLQNQPR